MRSIRWRIVLPFFLLVLLGSVALSFFLSSFLRREQLGRLETQLVAQARMVGDVVEPLLVAQAGTDVLTPQVTRWGKSLEQRITIIGIDGVVLGDSLEDPAVMDNHLARPEVQQALAEGAGTSSRQSSTMSFQMMYAAVPIFSDGRPVGVARVALPVEDVEDDLAQIRNLVAGTLLLVALVVGALIFLSADSVARPLRKLTEMAEAMAGGDMSGRIYVSSQDEVGRLANSFNWMAAEIKSQLDALASQRNLLEAVLTLMADGVVVTSADERVRLINPAAARILAVSDRDVRGERFAVVARDYQVVEVWRRCKQSNQEQSETVDLVGKSPFLQVVVTPLQEGGCLVLLQDLTRIRRLETVRRDFISNISHELRTPLASLRALVETIQGSALDDPPAAERFLGMMDTEVDALAQMVEELLELSRIESGQVPLRLAPVTLAEVVISPVERLRPQAKRAQVRLEIDRPALNAQPQVYADSQRIGQVVANLVHNAIKFTPKKGRVSIAAFRSDGEVVVTVSDTGVGIPAADLDRIFERFYKADQARSGGGTGLGLAIARHLVQAHGGRIWATSTPGQGSTFYFSLPVVT